MLILNIFILLITILNPGLSTNVDNGNDIYTVNVTMKGYQSTKEDQIVYIQYKLPDEELTVVGYTPLVSMATVHHMDAFACETPGSQEPFWNDGYPCGQGSQTLLYGWDRDALPFHFPEGVGIAVGKNTPYKYLIVNTHYLPMVKNDYSGNQFLISRKREKYLAGVVLAGTDSIYLPPKTHTIKTPFSCLYNGPNISIFAAGVHAHRWARVNSMYRMRDEKLTLIIKGDPQQTHHSYLLPSPIEVIDGDYLVGQCVYDNDENRTVTVGLTHNDEMCNVMAGYLYERNSDKQIGARIPLDFCAGDPFPHLSALIPSDSEIPPKKNDQYGQNALHQFELTPGNDLSTHTFKKRIDFHDKIFYISLIIVVALGIVFLLAVIIGRFVRMRTSGCPGDLDCLNTLFEKDLRTGPSRCPIFRNWHNRGDGFQQLEQSSDGENELIDNEV